MIIKPLLSHSNFFFLSWCSYKQKSRDEWELANEKKFFFDEDSHDPS